MPPARFARPKRSTPAIVVAKLGVIRLRHLGPKLRRSLVPADPCGIDEVDSSSVAANSIDLYLSRGLGHDDSGLFAGQFARISHRLAKIARRRGQYLVLLDIDRNIVGRSEFKASRVLQRLARDRNIEAEMVAQLDGFYEGCRADGIEQRFHLISIMYAG